MRRISKREFSVIVERDEEGYYVASVPELPGCHTQARSLDKLMDRIREAIALCLEVERDPEGRRDGGRGFCEMVVKSPNRVAGRIDLSAPTSPGMRVSTRRFRSDERRQGPTGGSAFRHAVRSIVAAGWARPVPRAKCCPRPDVYKTQWGQFHMLVLMTNHYHLVVRTLEPNLSEAMRWLQVSCSSQF